MSSSDPRSLIPDPPSVSVLVIGNEVLSGRVQDLNLNMIAKGLFERGLRFAEARVVPDIEDEIVEALNALRARSDFVFTTGGIGPTHDDITVASIAKAFGVRVVEHPEARARLAAYYGGEENLNPARLRMALVPEGAGIIDNPISGAPGVRMQNVFIMAGVPAIAKAMFEAALATLPTGPRIHSITIKSTVLESLIADELTQLAARFPMVDIGSYPSLKDGRPSLAFVAKGTNLATVREAVEALAALVRAYGGEPDIE